MKTSIILFFVVIGSSAIAQTTTHVAKPSVEVSKENAKRVLQAPGVIQMPEPYISTGSASKPTLTAAPQPKLILQANTLAPIPLSVKRNGDGIEEIIGESTAKMIMPSGGIAPTQMTSSSNAKQK